MPRPSTNRLRLLPFFSPIRGIRSHGVSGERCFTQRTINVLPFPGNASHLLIFDQTGSPEALKEASRLPAQKMPMNGAGTAKLFLGQRLPLDAGSQHIDNPGKDLPGR
jgi:hypothetical protein